MKTTEMYCEFFNQAHIKQLTMLCRFKRSTRDYKAILTLFRSFHTFLFLSIQPRSYVSPKNRESYLVMILNGTTVCKVLIPLRLHENMSKVTQMANIQADWNKLNVCIYIYLYIYINIGKVKGYFLNMPIFFYD